MELSKFSSYLHIDPNKLMKAQGLVEKSLVMFNRDDDRVESYLRTHLGGESLEYAMYLISEESMSYMGTSVHFNGQTYSAPTLAIYNVKSKPELKSKIKEKVTSRNERQKSTKSEEIDHITEREMDEPGESDNNSAVKSHNRSLKNKYGKKLYPTGRAGYARRPDISKDPRYGSVGESLDPVGKEDEDVDNDGKKNTKSDKYLLKRRSAISKALATRKEDRDLDEATAMAKRGHDETAIRNKIAKSTGGGSFADKATALADRQTYGDKKKKVGRENLARKQRGDFRNTTSSSPGLHGYGHKSNDPAVKAKQSARGAQRGAITPVEKKQLNREEFESDLEMLEQYHTLKKYFLENDIANTEEEVLEIFENISDDDFDYFMNEAEQTIKVVGKKKDGVIINPKVNGIDNIREQSPMQPQMVAKKTQPPNVQSDQKNQQVQKKQLMLNKQKVALQQSATSKKQSTDMHVEENIHEVDLSTQGPDFSNQIVNAENKPTKKGKKLSDFKSLIAKNKNKSESVEYVEEKDDPCWKGYTQVGMKKKGGKEVPNCVPSKGVPKSKGYKNK